MEPEVSYSELKFPMDCDVTYAQLKLPRDSDVTYTQLKFPPMVQQKKTRQGGLVRTTVTTPGKTPASSSSSSSSCTVSARPLGLLLCVLLLTVITLAVCSVRWSNQLQQTLVEVAQCSANVTLMWENLTKVEEDLNTTQQNLSLLLSAHRETTSKNVKLLETLQLTNSSLQGLLIQRRQAEEQSEQSWHQLPEWNQFHCYREKIPVLRCWSCHPGWTFQNQHCYYFSTNTTNWQKSKEECVSYNSQLVSVNSREEQSFINSKMEGGMNKYWMGYSDAVQEGLWIWEDGSSNTQKFWKAGQPDNYRKKENCATTERMYVIWYSWNDDNCNNPFRYICEKDADQMIFTVKGAAL